jgi:hypothetical protein
MNISILAVDLGDVSVQIVIGVIATVIGASFIAMLVATWRRRRKPIDWAVAGAAAGQRAFADRERRTEAANHHELVGHVLERADVLRVEVPEKTSGSNPVVITYRPSGRRYGFYRDHESYIRDRDGGRVNPSNAHPRKAPPVVAKWSNEQLRAWLDDHADDLPPTAGRAA